MAANRLYDYAKEERPLKNPHHAALLHFIPQATLAKNETSEDFFPLPEAPMPPPKPAPIPPSIQTPPLIKTPPIPKKDKIYIVQHGDSLWKIARRFKVDIDVIRQKNQLESDFLKPGTPLRIP
jgi:nucleoid-associated protein YgaU